MAGRRYHNPKGRAEVGEYPDAVPAALVCGQLRGRAAALNPGNRFETLRLHVLGEFLDGQFHPPEDSPAHSTANQPAPWVAAPRTILYADRSRSVINRVRCPDIGYEWTLNPYRGCEHGCIYCYARAYHEYLGFSCGLDFETRIILKPQAPDLLRQELARPSWTAQMIVMSAVADCWQPLEEKFQLARACLKVLADCRQPVAILSRNLRLLRDLDLLLALHEYRAVHVYVSLTTLDNRLAALMEPRASSPADRLKLIRELSRAGLPVQAMLAPIIPGLTDREIPALLEAAAEAGATCAGYAIVRLPYQLKDLFSNWLRRNLPDRASHIETLLKELFGGKLYDSQWYTRFRGRGRIARQIADLFRVFRQRYGLDRPLPAVSSAAFRRPAPAASSGQMTLF